MERRIVTLHWPAGGMNERWGFQNQAPYSCIKGLNVRNDDWNVAGRERGGSRPGLAKAFDEQITGSAGNETQRILLRGPATDLSFAPVTGGTFTLTFDSQTTAAIAYNATAATLKSALEALSNIAPGDVLVTKNGHGDYSVEFAGAYAATDVSTMTATSSLTSGPYLTLATSQNGGGGSNEIQVLTDATPDGLYSFKLRYPDSGVYGDWIGGPITPNAITAAQVEQALNEYLWSTVGLGTSGTNLVEVTGTEDGPYTIEHVDALANTNIAAWDIFGTVFFGPGDSGSNAGGSCTISISSDSSSGIRMLNTIQYIAADALQARVVAIANGQLYHEAPVGTMTAVGSGAFNVDKLLHSADQDQLLYIADHDDSPTLSAGARQPKIYDPATNSVTDWTADDDADGNALGAVPLGCPCIASWRARLVLAGGTTTPHGVFMSRQGDPNDWDYSETDVGAAVSLTLAHAGQMGDVVTCVAPHGDNCLILGGETSLWILRGDPSYGNLHNLSATHGVIDRGAWCTTPDGLFVFLSQDGVYMVPAGCEAAQAPVSVSREKLPAELLATNKTTHTVAMAYDVVDRGIHIFLTPNTAGSTASGHWFLDWESKAFWQVTLGSTNHEPFAIHARKNWYTTNSGVILGCRDGYIRYHSHSADDDDGTDFSSEVWLGPIGDSTLFSDTMLAEIAATLGTGSGQVLFEIYQADSPEAAFAGSPIYQSYWSYGRNPAEHPRIRGQSLYIRLTNGEDGVAWSWEAGYAVIGRKGKTRP